MRRFQDSDLLRSARKHRLPSEVGAVREALPDRFRLTGGLLTLLLTVCPADDSRAEVCQSPVDRFGERLLVLDAHTVAVGSPFANGGSGWLGIVDTSSCEVLQSWDGPPESQLGWALARGDLDGDGWPELIVGLPGTATGTVPGEVRIHRGGSGGWEESPWRVLPASTPGERFGESLLVFDPDGDGRPDLAVGAGTFTGRWVFEGAVRLYRGSGSDLDLVPSWAQTGRAVAAGFGRSLGGGDLDGDGRDDLLVGSPEGSWGQNREGRAELFLGGGSGGLEALPVWSVEGGEPYAYFGLAVAVLGTPSHLGPAVWAVGAPGTDGGRGGLSLFHGPGFPVAPGFRRVETEVGAWFGGVLCPAWVGMWGGLAVGAPGAAGGAGRVEVLTWDPCSRSFDWLEPSEGSSGAYLGTSVSAAEGVLWMGAPWQETASGRGAVLRRSLPEASTVPFWAGGVPGRENRPGERSWRPLLSPHPVSAATQLRIAGDAPCDVRWRCVSANGRRIGSEGTIELGGAVPWEQIRPRGTRTGWLVVTGGGRREVVRWVDLSPG